MRKWDPFRTVLTGRQSALALGGGLLFIGVLVLVAHREGWKRAKEMNER